jgi:hypothetical protein
MPKKIGVYTATHRQRGDNISIKSQKIGGYKERHTDGKVISQATKLQEGVDILGTVIS